MTNIISRFSFIFQIMDEASRNTDRMKEARDILSIADSLGFKALDALGKLSWFNREISNIFHFDF